MKINQFCLSLFLLLFVHLNSQTKTYQLNSTDLLVNLGESHTGVNLFSVSAKSPVSRFIKKIEELQGTIDENDEKYPIFNDETLNLLFANKLGTAFGNSSDLSLQRYFFSLDATDNSLSVGYNFDNRSGKGLKQLNWVYGASLKIVSKNKFATLFQSDDFLEDNIGLTLKATWVGNGRINWNNEKIESATSKKHRLAIEANRKYMYYAYNEKVKNFNEKELPKIAEYVNTMVALNKEQDTLSKVLEEKSDNLYEEMIKEELEFIDKNKLFISLTNWWVTSEVYIPIGDTFYNITPITEDNKASKAQYYAFDANVSFNMYREWSNSKSFFLNLRAGVRGNNNIAVNGLESKAIQSIIIENEVLELTEPVSAISIEEYDRFVTPSLKLEFAVFYKNTIGFSPALEKNFGTYNGLNWKLGIPVSLKDKEGKPTINFELQWREDKTLNNNRHLIGFSTNFIFGNLTK